MNSAIQVYMFDPHCQGMNSVIQVYIYHRRMIPNKMPMIDKMLFNKT